jgi:hypothetical protein
MMFAACRQRASVGMRREDRWEDTVVGMLDDLEMQAEGLHLAERAVEVDELSVAQYAEVELAARLHASIGGSVRIGMVEGPELHGRLAGAGSDWVLVDDDRGCAWFAHLQQVAVIRGLDFHSVPDEARPLSARLSLRSILRRLAGGRQRCVLHLVGGRTLHGVLARVGADFVELGQAGAGEPVTVPLAAVAVVQDQSWGPS